MARPKDPNALPCRGCKRVRTPHRCPACKRALCANCLREGALHIYGGEEPRDCFGVVAKMVGGSAR